MLTPEAVETLLTPISEASPCGEDLEYDPAFIALEAVARGKPEQQFGDTLIPAVEPEWPQVSEQAQALLRRSKDVRPGVLLLRAATRLQGLDGFTLGMQLLTELAETYWEKLHPALDADDGDDPTMRLNALAPLSDELLLVRDLLDAHIGSARSVGALRVRDVAVARNAFPSTEHSYSPAQVDGALQEIAAERPEALARMQAIAPAVARLQKLLSERSGRSDAVDFSRLRGVGQALQQAARALAGDASTATEAPPATDVPGSHALPAGSQPLAVRGDIQTRQEAIQMLDRVIAYLEHAEPGNPAPLLIERAKKLIGVSFLDIIANLAPDAMSAIENVTGARASE